MTASSCPCGTSLCCDRADICCSPLAARCSNLQVARSRAGSPKNNSSSSSSSNSTGESKATSSSKSSSSSAAAKPGSVPWGQFFRSPPVWAVTVAHFCFNWGYYTLLAWLPSYFELALGLNVQDSSFLTLIPYVAMIAMTPVVSSSGSGPRQGVYTSGIVAIIGATLCQAPM